MRSLRLEDGRWTRPGHAGAGALWLYVGVGRNQPTILSVCLNSELWCISSPPLSVHSRVVGCRCRPLRRAHPLRAVWLAPASRFAMRDAVDDVATARLLLVVRLVVYTCWSSTLMCVPPKRYVNVMVLPTEQSRVKRTIDLYC